MFPNRRPGPSFPPAASPATYCPPPFSSTHTGGFEGYTFRDLSDEIPAVLKHWESLGLTFDFIYSGYLGNVSQIETVREIKRRFLKRNGKFIVDPVMGDGGKLYAHFDFHFVEKMRVLCEEADFILPNVTEACLLAGENYPLSIERLPAEKIVGILRSPHTCPIVTGVEEGEENAVYYGEANGVAATRSRTPKVFFTERATYSPRRLRAVWREEKAKKRQSNSRQILRRQPFSARQKRAATAVTVCFSKRKFSIF